MKNILIIDPDKTLASSLRHEIITLLDVDVKIATSAKEADQYSEGDTVFHAVIVDPTLTDDTEARIIDRLIRRQIPVIAFLTDNNPVLLDRIIHKPISDYVMKTHRNAKTMIIQLLSQILRHSQTAILVIDDSEMTRNHISELLENLNLDILTAANVEEALKVIQSHPEVKLVLADYNMEGLTGVDLTIEIRKQYSNKEISIIGHSSYGTTKIGTQFIKNGANDFISKPFDKEDLISRVLLQLDTIDYISHLKERSDKDFLTGIYNRRYIYEVGRKLFDNARRGNMKMACAMIDIDHFKVVNDTYGHDIGDEVIIRLAQELTESFRMSDLVGRLGGEEFCVILANPDVDLIETLLDDLRKKIEQIVISGVDENNASYQFSFTISIGATMQISKSFEEMLKFADLKLYEAKNYGRNMVVI